MANDVTYNTSVERIGDMIDELVQLANTHNEQLLNVKSYLGVSDKIALDKINFIAQCWKTKDEDCCNLLQKIIFLINLRYKG